MFANEDSPLVNGIESNHVEPAEPAKPAEAVQPAQPVQPTEVAKDEPPSPIPVTASPAANTTKSEYRPSLIGLPHELRTHVVQHLKKISDLQRVSLSCRAMHAAAIPVLYQRMTLTLGGPQDKQIQNTLSFRNPGLKNVHHLRIRVEKELSKKIWREMTRKSPSDDLEEEPQGFYHSSAQAQVMLGMILELLPRDQLLSLNWNTWDPLTIENWVKMYTTQKNIRQIEIGPLETGLLDAIKKRPDIFKNLKSPTGLFIWPNSIEALEVGQLALQDLAGSVDNLLINCVGLRSLGNSAGEMMDSSTTPGLINRTLFKHMTPFDRCSPLKLRELYVTEMQLHHASTTLLKVINFQCLESLILDDCAGAGNVFAEMCKSYARPANLKRICWLDGTRTQVDANDIQTFEEWLQSFKGLQYIHIDIGNPTEPVKPLAIKTHGDSLRSLFIRFGLGGTTTVKYTAVQMEEICERCTKIRQMSIPLPEIEARSGKSFEEDDLKRQIAATRQLPYLETLCIQDWPSTNLGDNEWRSRDNLAYYNHQLGLLATKLFRAADQHARQQQADSARGSATMTTTTKTARLSTVAFGVSHWSLYDPSNNIKLQQALFMRGEMVDPFGAKSLCAVQVDKSRLRETGQEDESVVAGGDSGPIFKDLDYVLYED